MGEWFRVDATVDLAVEAFGGPGLSPVEGRRLASEARGVLDVLSNRRDAEVKRALAMVLDAVEALERELELMQRRAMLTSRGVSLRPWAVRIGADGLTAERPLEPVGDVVVHLCLYMRGQQHLLSLPAEVAPDGRHVRFAITEPADRDTLVAYTFEQQRKERRRELDAAAG